MEDLRLKAEKPADAATRKMASRMAMRGQALSGYQFHNAQKPYCDEPVAIRRAVRAGGLHRSIEVSMFGPCRKCEKCLLFRKMKWRERALHELDHTWSQNRRTWMLALTFSPTHLAGVIMEAQKLRGPGDLVERAAYRHVQLYFKRLRKAGARFRYLAIFERGGESGRPHYHAFIHESGPRPILHQMLDSQWRSFANPKLIRSQDAVGKASYITTYATKSFDIRPRASVGYGKGLRKPPQPPPTPA